jgi:hypothetical protein
LTPSAVCWRNGIETLIYHWTLRAKHGVLAHWPSRSVMQEVFAAFGNMLRNIKLKLRGIHTI